MSQDQRVRRGYLLLADISGYTAFLTGTELEHASAARDAMPGIRDWLTANAWLVNLVVIIYFIYELIK